MRIEQLAYLIDISKTGSINLSAERLFVTQPTISEALSKLEKELDVVLFDRHSRGITLTAAGEIVVAQAKHITEHIQLMEKQLIQSKQENEKQYQGKLTLASTQVSSSGLLGVLMLKFSEHYPLINICQHEVDRASAVAQFGRLMVDLGFIHALANAQFAGEKQGAFHDQGYELREIKRENLQVVMHKSRPLATRKAISVQEILSEPFIHVNKGLYGESNLVKIISEYGEFDNMIITGDAQTYNDYIVGGMRNAFMSKGSWQRLLYQYPELAKNLRMVALKEEIQVIFYVAIPQKRPLSENAALFLDFIERQMK